MALCLLVSAGVTAAADSLPPGGTFSDDNGNIHEGYIEAIAAAGITKGCNPPTNDHYCPDDVVTRGQMAAFLVRALHLTDDGGGNTFTDDNGTVFEDDIAKLAAAGITKGCNPPTNNHYCPNQVVTRGQMAAFLVRALHLTDDGGGNTFTDDNGTVFEDDIAKLAAAQITKGCNPPTNNHYCPNDPVHRDQMASFLGRALNLTPTTPQPGPSIVYTNDGIWITDSAGSFHTELAEAGVAPRISPDGNLIGYLADWCVAVVGDECIDSLPHVEVITIDGTPLASFDIEAFLTSQGLSSGSFGFSWTPDGMVGLDAGWSTNGNDRGIWVVSLDGSHIEKIADNPDGHETAPEFSPDGTRIAYQSTTMGDSLIVIGKIGDMLTYSYSLVGSTYYGAQAYDWSPDSRFLAYATDSGSGTTLIIHNLVTTLRGVIASDIGYVADPMWSPDGSQLTFSSSQDGDYEIYVYTFTNLDGSDFGFLDGDLTQLTFNSGISDTEPAWSRDGTQIAFTRDSDIFVMNADGSNQHQVAIGSQPQWSP